MQVSA
jgi:hypothetical protein